jgi:deoxyribodipyrimidine photo-lyase
MTLTNIENPAHAPASLLPNWMLAERTFALTPQLLEQPKTKVGKQLPGSSVVYWMQRDVRTVDNWALLWAAYLAASQKVPLHVVYVLPPPPLSSQQGDDNNLPPALADVSMTERHGMFLLGGLECVWKELKEKNIPLHVIQPPSHAVVGETVCETLLDKCNAGIVVCDFSPIREFREWKELQAAPILSKASVPFYQVDAHNIVPVWEAAEKRQVGARTLRPKIHKVIGQYLQRFPVLLEAKVNVDVTLPEFDRQSYESFLQMDKAVPVVDWAEPGTKAAMKQFDFFAKNGLKSFDTLRNDPVQKDICSDLSPWINHGQVSFASITKEVKKLNKYANGTASFIEEGVIRRELSDNFVYYSPNDYDSLETAAGWVKETLKTHASDAREYLYTLEELEQGKTHDDLWNAAQLQVVREGRMHGFMRMYWAKKILEWTESPTFALRAAQYLNDKYALDGKDSNGFTGVGWSIMGIHDQGWKERPVFGKIRFMNYAGCKRKFKVVTFVAQYPGASENAIKATEKHSSKGEKRQTTLTDVVKKKKPKTSA